MMYYSRNERVLEAQCMHSLSAGKRAYLTTQLQNSVFTPQQAVDYAMQQWNVDVDVGSIEAYMKHEPDPLLPQPVHQCFIVFWPVTTKKGLVACLVAFLAAFSILLHT